MVVVEQLPDPTANRRPQFATSMKAIMEPVEIHPESHPQDIALKIPSGGG